MHKKRIKENTLIRVLLDMRVTFIQPAQHHCLLVQQTLCKCNSDCCSDNRNTKMTSLLSGSTDQVARLATLQYLNVDIFYTFIITTM